MYVYIYISIYHIYTHKYVYINTSIYHIYTHIYPSYIYTQTYLIQILYTGRWAQIHYDPGCQLDGHNINRIRNADAPTEGGERYFPSLILQTDVVLLVKDTRQIGLIKKDRLNYSSILQKRRIKETVFCKRDL